MQMGLPSHRHTGGKTRAADDCGAELRKKACWCDDGLDRFSHTFGSRLVCEWRLHPRHLLRLFTEMTAGLAAMHDAGLAHWDVSLGNFFVTSAVSVRLGDFALTRGKDDGYVAGL